MSLTVRQVADDLLRYLAAEQRTIPPPSAVDDPLPGVLDAIHGALTELATIAPNHLFRDRRSAQIYAPVDLTIPTVTSGASTFTFTAGNGWLDWMLGCSIQFNGGEPFNEILDYDSTAHVVTLLHPVQTGGVNIGAKVWCDSILIATDVLQVNPPITLADQYVLSPIHTLSDLQAALYQYWPQEDYGRQGTLTTSARRTQYRPAPFAYFVDTRFQSSYDLASVRMRLAPMPTQANVLHYRARLAPLLYTIADIYDAGTPAADPGTAIPISENLAHAVFKPMARQRFTGCPFYRNDNALPEISRQYQLAMDILRQMTPQAQPGFRIRPSF